MSSTAPTRDELIERYAALKVQAEANHALLVKIETLVKRKLDFSLPSGAHHHVTLAEIYGLVQAKQKP